MKSPLSELSLPCAPDEIDEFLSRPTPAVVETIDGLPGPILVLGAGGKMGLHLCAMLQRGLAQLRRPEQVIAVSRFSTLRDRDEFECFGIKTVACDLSDAAALAALPSAPTVFFLAGVKFGTANSPELLRKMNAEMPRAVAERFRDCRIVAFSSGCVYPYVAPVTGGATEETPVAANGDYAASCIAREEAFADGSRRNRTPVALIRLNYSVEFRYGVLVDIAEKVRRGTPIDLTTGHVNVIWQSDAIAHTIQSVRLAGSPAVPVNITGAEILSVRQLAERFGELLERTPCFTGAEAPTAWLNNASRSHGLFGPPATSIDQMIRWVAAWLARDGATWHKPTGYDRRDGKF